MDRLKLPKGVLDEQELEDILEDETGLEEAAEGQIVKKTVTSADGESDSLLKKIETIEKEIMSIKSETAFLREMLKEQSDTLLELTRLVKDLMK